MADSHKSSAPWKVSFSCVLGSCALGWFPKGNFKCRQCLWWILQRVPGQTAVKPSKGRLLCKGTAKAHLCSVIPFRNQDLTLHWCRPAFAKGIDWGGGGAARARGLWSHVEARPRPVVGPGLVGRCLPRKCLSSADSCWHGGGPSKMALRPGAGASGAAGAGAGPGGAGRWVGGAGRGTGGAGRWVGGMGRWGRAHGRQLRGAGVLGTRGERAPVQAPPHLSRGLERPRFPSRLFGLGLELLLERRLWQPGHKAAGAFLRVSAVIVFPPLERPVLSFFFSKRTNRKTWRPLN